MQCQQHVMQCRQHLSAENGQVPQGSVRTQRKEQGEEVPHHRHTQDVVGYHSLLCTAARSEAHLAQHVPHCI